MGLASTWPLTFALFRLGKAVRHTATRDYSLAVMTLAVAVALLLGLVDGNLVMPVSQIGAALDGRHVDGAVRASRTTTLARVEVCCVLNT